MNHFAVYQKLNNIVNQLYFKKINVELLNIQKMNSQLRL